MSAQYLRWSCLLLPGNFLFQLLTKFLQVQVCCLSFPPVYAWLNFHLGDRKAVHCRWNSGECVEYPLQSPVHLRVRLGSISCCSSFFTFICLLMVKGLTGSALALVIANYLQCLWLLLYIRYMFSAEETWKGFANFHAYRSVLNPIYAAGAQPVCMTGLRTSNLVCFKKSQLFKHVAPYFPSRRSRTIDDLPGMVDV